MNRYNARWVQNNFEILPSLLTKNEQLFYLSLKKVVGDKFVIMAKVRLEDIFSANKGRDHYIARNMIKSRHVDFLLCKPNSLIPVLGIELDDKSHQRPDRVKRDIFVNRLFQTNNLPLLRIKSRHKYDPVSIKEDIVSILSDTIST